jgi:LysR family transcriptional regulator, hydrogen peroxide-inducible genes activator
LIGTLRLGVIYTIAPYLLPRLIPEMHTLAPLMPLYLQENFTHNLAEQLRQGQLDVVVVAHPFTEPGIVTLAVYDEPFCLALPAGHPLAERTSIDPKQIAGENLLLLGNGNCFRDQVVQACPRLTELGGTDGTFEGSSLETIRHMVASGAGISVVPASAAKSWPQNDPLLQFRSFTEPAPFRRVVIAWRASFPRSRAIDMLRGAIQASPPFGVALIS